MSWTAALARTFALAAALGGGVAEAREAVLHPAVMYAGDPVEAPRGYTEMCARDAALCAALAATGPEAATPAVASDDAGGLSFAIATPAVFWSGAVEWPGFKRSVDTASVFGLVPFSRVPFGGPAASPLETGFETPYPARFATAELAPVKQVFAPAVEAPFGPAARSIAPADEERLLREVNLLVNTHVRQRSDKDSHGESEYWTRTGLDRGAVGDCEDLAIEKRLQLIAAGFPANDLFFAIGYLHGMGLHTVLIAHTEAGDRMLDSLSPYVDPLSQAPYIWVTREAAGRPGHWISAIPLLPLRMASLEARATPGM